MNSLYTSGVRQTSSIQTDLERLRNGDTSSALLGQISASLSAMRRTIDDYDSMAKREMIKTKQEKAQLRIQKFRTDYADMKDEFERLKGVANAKQEASARSELFGSAVPGSSDARRRLQPSYGQNNTQSTELHSESPFRSSTPQPGFGLREQHALDEHSFINRTNDALDGFLAQGRDVLENLHDQKQILKGTKRRVLDAANTLGLSRDVIGWIERRSTQDTYIFIGGAIFTFFCFYIIWRYLG